MSFEAQPASDTAAITTNKHFFIVISREVWMGNFIHLLTKSLSKFQFV